MTETIGNYIFISNVKNFTISYEGGNKYYFDIFLTSTKILVPLGFLLYFNAFTNIDSISDLIFPFFVAMWILIHLSTLYGLIGKPSKDILKYDKINNSFTLKTNHFRVKKIDLKMEDTILVEKFKERVTYDESSARRYFYVVNHINKDRIKNELFTINPSNIISTGEYETIRELNNVSKKLVNRISTITGIKSEYSNLIKQ